MAQAVAAPKSCPTTWLRPIAEVIEHGHHVADRVEDQ